jgi:hypothetical protein
MPRSVKITTPIPTLDEVGDSLGLSKARRNRLLAIVRSTTNDKFVTRRSKSDKAVAGTRKSNGEVAARKKA